MSACPPPPISPRPPGVEAAPFWSVMMPTYNPRREILEIVVVDDASPNGSPESWVREIAGDRVRFVRQPQNLGLAEIWNTCIGMARGEWIHILHQDDVLQPGYYASLRRGIDRAGCGCGVLPVLLH